MKSKIFDDDCDMTYDEKVYDKVKVVQDNDNIDEDEQEEDELDVDDNIDD